MTQVPPINRHFIKACNHLTFTAAISANAPHTKLALSDTITGLIGPVLTPINYGIARRITEDTAMGETV